MIGILLEFFGLEYRNANTFQITSSTNQSSSAKSFKVVLTAASPSENGFSSLSASSLAGTEALDEADIKWLLVEDDGGWIILELVFCGGWLFLKWKALDNLINKWLHDKSAGIEQLMLTLKFGYTPTHRLSFEKFTWAKSSINHC